MGGRDLTASVQAFNDTTMYDQFAPKLGRMTAFESRLKFPACSDMPGDWIPRAAGPFLPRTADGPRARDLLLFGGIDGW